MYRPLAAANPARFAPDLAGSLGNLSRILADAGDRQGALAAIREAIRLIEPRAAAYPNSQAGRWLVIMREDLAILEGPEDRAAG